MSGHPMYLQMNVGNDWKVEAALSKRIDRRLWEKGPSSFCSQSFLLKETFGKRTRNSFFFCDLFKKGVNLATYKLRYLEKSQSIFPWLD